MSPLSSFAESPLFNFNDPLTPLLPTFTLDRETDPEITELLLPDEIITLLYLSDPSLPLINNTYLPAVPPELGAKLDVPPLPPT